MIKSSYDQISNELHVSVDCLDLKGILRDSLMIVHGLVQMIRMGYGKEASEAFLQTIRNLDDASVFSLDIGDGDADEKSQTQTDVDRSGGAGTDGLCIRGEEQRGTGTAGDGQGGGAGAGESQA